MDKQGFVRIPCDDGSEASAERYTEPTRAGVAKLADAQDLKSWDPKGSCGFDSHPRHHDPSRGWSRRLMLIVNRRLKSEDKR